MSLFDQASILITPNAVKAGKLYSIKPTDGSGDLSVVRATSATIPKNAQGLVEVPRTNLVLQSQTFENAYWGKDAGFVVTANSTIAPDGSLTADKLDISASTGALFRSGNTVVSNSSYTSSIYIKAEGTNIGRTITFEITPTLVRNTIILTGEWQRITANTTASTTALNFVIRKLITDTADSFFIWGAQLEAGVTATEYIPTIASIRTKFAGITQDGGSASNIARLDYTNGSCPSILVEPQRTNLVLRSEEFNLSPWSALGTIIITPNATTSPDGNLTADLILGADSTSNVNQIIAGTIGVVYTNSFYIKNNNSTQSQVLIRNSTSVVAANINWSGSILTSIINIAGTTTFQNVGNGWYRIISTYTAVEAPQRPRIYPTLNTNQSVYLWGAQLEAGSNATSYIPTVASAVTRNADVISKTGISDLINSVEGCFYVEAKAFVNGGSFRLISISDGTTNNRITMGWSTITNTLLAFMNIGGTIRVNNNITPFSQTSNNKILFRWGSGNFNVFVNGVNRLSLTSVTMPTANLFNKLSFDLGTTSSLFEGNVKSVLVFPTQLTDTECINLTTL
jgi:hypothetical protein